MAWLWSCSHRADRRRRQGLERKGSSLEKAWHFREVSFPRVGQLVHAVALADSKAQLRSTLVVASRAREPIGGSASQSGWAKKKAGTRSRAPAHQWQSMRSNFRRE